jgi:hypothetical protein
MQIGLMALGAVLLLATLIAAFWQSPTDPTAFDQSMWLAGVLAVAAMLCLAAGLLMGMRRQR